MKLETIPNETWVERQLRAMDVIRETVSVSPQACLKFLLEANIITLREAKKHGYISSSRRSKIKQ
jgi:hypothetical protein